MLRVMDGRSAAAKRMAWRYQVAAPARSTLVIVRRVIQGYACIVHFLCAESWIPTASRKKFRMQPSRVK